MARRAERARRRRGQLGADTLWARTRRPDMGPASAEARLARSAGPHASRPDRPSGRTLPRGAALPAPRVACQPALLCGLGAPRSHGAARAHLRRAVAVTRDARPAALHPRHREIPTSKLAYQTRAQTLQRARQEVARRLAVTVDGRRVALRDTATALLSHPRGQGWPEHDPHRARVAGRRDRRRNRCAARRHLSRPFGLHGARRASREGHRGALNRVVGGPYARAAPLPALGGAAPA